MLPIGKKKKKKPSRFTVSLILHSHFEINLSQFSANKLDSTKIVHCKLKVKILHLTDIIITYQCKVYKITI